MAAGGSLTPAFSSISFPALAEYVTKQRRETARRCLLSLYLYQASLIVFPLLELLVHL